MLLTKPTSRRSCARSVAVLACVALLATGGCATVLGTIASPVTGGIGLARGSDADGDAPHLGYWTPFLFVGGALTGPFVAIYNGVRHDLSVFRGVGPYWSDLGLVLQPYEMIAARS